MSHPVACHPLSRRGFLATAAAAAAARAFAAPAADALTIGLFTDSHYADRAPGGSRHYRDSAAKLTDFVATMNPLRPSFCIVLGDFVDKGNTLADERAYLKHIQAIYARLDGPRHYVIGNHDVTTFTKDQFVALTGIPAPHYAFDAGPCRCIVLDANYRKDFSPYCAGNFKWTEATVPPDEQRWLADQLARTTRPALVFVHQQLDDERSAHGVKNGHDVRRILERSGKVKAVFQGHNHRGGHRIIEGIHYFTMRAMVEGPGAANNAYALARVSPEGVAIRGYGKQPRWPA
ncbi:metallophosphoesterase [bacterium]|nr:metallophosphoesterase [bacterium]